MRIAIKEFGIIQKPLAGATVSIYLTDDTGINTGVKAALYQAATGSATRQNPQVLDENGMLEAPVYVDGPVMAEVYNLSPLAVRTVQKVRENPTVYSLPITSAATYAKNIEGAEILDSTIDNTVIGGTTAANGTFINLVCASFTETSDERLKDNVEPLHEATQALLALRPVRYTRKSTSPIVRQEMGLIAQHTQTVLPETVSQPDNGYMAIHYLDLIALLIAGYQELEQRIKTLEAK